MLKVNNDILQLLMQRNVLIEMQQDIELKIINMYIKQQDKELVDQHERREKSQGEIKGHIKE
jgi:hypothetical protein